MPLLLSQHATLSHQPRLSYTTEAKQPLSLARKVQRQVTRVLVVASRRAHVASQEGLVQTLKPASNEAFKLHDYALQSMHQL